MNLNNRPDSLKTAGTSASPFLCLWIFLLAVASPAPSSAPGVSVSHFQLKNGLQVILSEDFTLPLVGVAVTYRSGSLHDPPGKSGMAYLLENLMFLGSDNVGQMQHIGYITRAGGTLNAATLEEKTYFHQTVPSNQLALVLWLESDRMRSLQLTPAKVEAAKKELIAELRRRHQQAPYLEAFFRFNRLLFPGPAGSRPIIGLEADIRSITFEDVRTFHRQRYGPQNALLCVTGSFNALQLRDLVSRYFESIPRSHEGLSPPPALPFERTAAVETFQSPDAPAPGVLMGFRAYSARE
ncbi:MAG: insulinase family protein, partial [Candidatus Aminicenantes bacterium]|nr:insulinase family protein [Candidatus Aminicenantes bacterium]